MVSCHSHLHYPLQDASSSYSESSFSLLGLSCSWWSVLSTWAPASYPHAPGDQLQPLPFMLTSLPSGSSRYVGVWAGVDLRRAGIECLFGPHLLASVYLFRLAQKVLGRAYFPSQSCPSGADPSGLHVDYLCPSGSQHHPSGAVCPH